MFSEHEANSDSWDDRDEEKALYMPNLSTYYGGMSFRNASERVSVYHAALGHPTVACLVS